MPVPQLMNRTIWSPLVPLSATSELLALSWTSNDSAIDSVVARSYGGNEWEYVRGLMLPGPLCHLWYTQHHEEGRCEIDCLHTPGYNCTVHFLPPHDDGSVSWGIYRPTSPKL